MSLEILSKLMSSLTLNLKTPQGREIAHKLAHKADVLVEN